MYEELVIKQNGRNVSLCFMNNETFKKELENKNADETLELGNAIYSSALKVLSDSNKRYGALKRQMEKMDKNSKMFEIASKRLDETNKTIENINEQIDIFENDKDEFAWIAYMINKCLGATCEEDED